jgi:glycosyltransferase involved in cell wall biosynthesis
LEGHFKERFGEVFKLWRFPASERYSRFVRYLKDNAIELVYITHSLWVYEHAARLKRDVPELKIVDSLHVLEPYCFRGGYPDISANRYVHPFIDRSIVISDYLLKYIKRHYSVNSMKFVVIRNSVDTKRFRKNASFKGTFRQEIDVPDKVPLIGFIGRFSRQKRPDIFLKVAQKLATQLDQVFFFMVGGGEFVEHSKLLAGKLGLMNRVRFVPPRDDMHIVLNSTDLLLVTSSYEGAPLTILESLATGVPVVSSDVGAIGEYIGREWLVMPGKGEIDELAGAVLRQLCSVNTVPFDREAFGTERLISCYEKVLASC